jgi:hypothetical protein
MLSGMGLDEYTVEVDQEVFLTLRTGSIGYWRGWRRAASLSSALARSRKPNSTSRRTTHGAGWSSIPQSAAPLAHVGSLRVGPSTPRTFQR